MGNSRAAFALVTLYALAASLALALLLFVCVPLGQDGSWYSYPAYAWSQGGDPSENIPTVMRQTPPPMREVVKFGWENRSNLTVLLTRAWFGVVAPSWASIKWFGVVQLAALALLVAAVTLRLTGDRLLASFSACLVISDARVLEQALASARPDLFISAVSMALLLLLLIARSSPNWKLWISAIVLAACLPMLHTSAANAMAFLMVFMTLVALADQNYIKSSRSIVVGIGLSGLLLIVFFYKQPLLDILIPTHVSLGDELPARHNMVEELEGIVRGGLKAKVTMEVNRWRDYFFMGGVAQFLTIATGLVLAAVLLRRRNPAFATALALFGAFLCAAISMAIFDSHPMVAHALVVAVFGYVGAIALAGAANRAGIITDRHLRAGCILVLLIAGTTNFLHAQRLNRQYRVPNITNAAEQTALLDALPATGDVKVIGPTEVWPYLASRKQPLILIDDDRARFSRLGGKLPENVDPNYAGAGYLVVNKELFATWQWNQMIDQWINQHLIVKISELGDCTRTVQCLRIYAFTPGARAH
jgi:hypothetical protein